MKPLLQSYFFLHLINKSKEVKYCQKKNVIITLKYTKVGKKLKFVSLIINEIAVLKPIPKNTPIIDTKLYIRYLQLIIELFLVGNVIDVFNHPDFLSILNIVVTLIPSTIVAIIIKTCGTTKNDIPKPMTINVISKLMIDDLIV